jgi:yeast amino acid transporter
VLNTAAVVGLIIAVLVVSITAICVMECLSEFIVLWPVPNALVEYVRSFVDEDLAIVIGLAYWFVSQNLLFLLSFYLTDRSH